jgi:hypothetical protein
LRGFGDRVPLGNAHDPRRHQAYMTGSSAVWDKSGDYARPGVEGNTAGSSRPATDPQKVQVSFSPPHGTVYYIMRTH